MRTRLKLIILGVIGLVGFLNFVPVGNVVKAAEIDYPAKACEGLKRFDACAYNDEGKDYIKNGYCVVSEEGGPHLFCKEAISASSTERGGCNGDLGNVAGAKRCINQDSSGVQKRGICNTPAAKGVTCSVGSTYRKEIEQEWSGWKFTSDGSNACSQSPIQCLDDKPICFYTLADTSGGSLGNPDEFLDYNGKDAKCFAENERLGSGTVPKCTVTCVRPGTCDAKLNKCNAPNVAGVECSTAKSCSGGFACNNGKCEAPGTKCTVKAEITNCYKEDKICRIINGKESCVVVVGKPPGDKCTTQAQIENCNKEGKLCRKSEGKEICADGYTPPSGGGGNTPTSPDVIQTISFQNPISANTLPELIATVIRGILGLLGSIAVLLIAYAGFKYMTSLGNASETQTALKIITSAIIGLVIIMGSFLITEYIISAVK